MNKILKYTLCVAIAAGMVSCSDDYLQTTPQDSTSKTDLFASPEAAQFAVNGLGRLMSKQYLETQGYNGEGTIYAYNGEFPGDGMQKLAYSGWQNIIKSNYNQSNNTNAQLGWYYYYRIIGNANQILDNIPEEFPSAGIKKEWDYIKAQALTMRAYSYTMLSQLFSRRWTYRNGESRGVVLRLDVSNNPKECASLKMVLDQVYTDLDEAIDLFETCGQDRSSDVDMRWLTNADVAHAIYSRAALVRNDWSTAIPHSQAARKGYSIMGPDEYKAGFNTANKEWIWEVFEDDTQPIYYYSFYNYMSGSCAGSASRTNPTLISKQIVDPIDPADERLAIFAVPTDEEIADLVKITREDDAKLDSPKIKPGTSDEQVFLDYFSTSVVTKGKYFNRVQNDFVKKGRLYKTTKIGLYQGTKFIVKSGVGDGCIPIFRVAEMLYNEAEAQFRLGNENAVRELLNEATQPYNASYNCTKTGDELWDELVAYRKFDLWSEGHSWFDLKRWGVSMVRKTWAQGGSWATYFAGDGTNGKTGGNFGPSDKNYWTMNIPQSETNYNNLVIPQEDDDWKLGNDY